MELGHGPFGFWRRDTDPLDVGDGTRTLGLDLGIGTRTLWILEMGRGPSNFGDGARTLEIFRMGQTFGILEWGGPLELVFRIRTLKHNRLKETK